MLSVIRLFVCYVPLAYLGSIYYGIEGFFIGGVCGNLIMGMISYRLFDKQFPHELPKIKEVSS
jgi:Na+-driven multidrug efflux pump